VTFNELKLETLQVVLSRVLRHQQARGNLVGGASLGAEEPKGAGKIADGTGLFEGRGCLLHGATLELPKPSYRCHPKSSLTLKVELQEVVEELDTVLMNLKV